MSGKRDLMVDCHVFELMVRKSVLRCRVPSTSASLPYISATSSKVRCHTPPWHNGTAASSGSVIKANSLSSWESRSGPDLPQHVTGLHRPCKRADPMDIIVLPHPLYRSN